MKTLIITVMIILFLFAVEFLACAFLSLIAPKKDGEADGD